MHSRRGYTQVELKVLPGAEPWVLIRHNGRYFKLMLDAPISEMMRGVQDGWDAENRRQTGAPVRLEEWRKWRVIGEGPTAASWRS